MKKIMSLVVVFLMMISCVALPTYAENQIVKKYDAIDDVLNKVHDDGFYDGGGAKKFETQGDFYISRPGDWVCYDISDLPAGFYNFTVSAGASHKYAKVTIMIDGDSIISKYPIISTGSYTVMADHNMGKIEIPEGAQRIKFENETGNTHAFFFESFTLTMINPPEILSYTTNAGENSGIVPYGADVFTLTMGAQLDTTSVSQKTVMIKDENGSVLSTDILAEGNTITLKLNEALKPDTTYTIYAENLKGSEGQVLTVPSEKVFKTSESTDKSGRAYCEVSSYEKNGNVITAEGIVKSSFQEGINGRNVYLSLKTPESEEFFTALSVLTETVDGENGRFVVSFTIPQSYEAGKYLLEISTDFSEDYFSESFMYFTEAIEKEITEAFTGIETKEDANNVLYAYIDYMGIDQTEMEEKISDFDMLYEALIGRQFDNATDAINAVKNDIYVTMIAQAESKDDIISILDDEEKNSYLIDFNVSLWNALSEDGKDNVATLALDFTEDIKSRLNEEVTKELMLQENLIIPTIEFSSSEVQAGETAEIKASLKEELSDVYGFVLDFEYDETSKVLFENAEISVADGLEYKTVIENGLYSVRVNAIKNQSDELKTITAYGDILTLNIKSSAKMIGTHNLSVKGYVLYHPSVIADKSMHIEALAEMLNYPSVTVTELEKLVIDVKNPTNFFDNPDAGGSNAGNIEIASECIISRKGEWVEYDISALSKGTYEVGFTYACKYAVEFNVLVDGVSPFIKKSLAATGDYGKFSDVVLGRAELSGSQSVLKLENTGLQAAYVKNITLTKINPLTVKNIYANDISVNADTNTIYRGTDNLKVEFNNQLNQEFVTGNNVILSDDNGKNIDCRINADNNIILIDLKETLDYGKEYTLKISNQIDKYGQNMQKIYSKTLKTYSENNDKGYAGLDIQSCKAIDDKLVLEGVVLSSEDVGIKGRTVKVFAKGEKETGYVLFAEGLSGDDGEFELLYTFDESKESGMYSLNIYIEYGETPFETDVYYFDSELSAQIANEFSNLPNGDAVDAKFESYAINLGIDYETVKEEIDISFITNKMANKVYNTATEIKNEFAARVVLEKINQTDENEKVVNIINDIKVFSDVGEIQRDKWDALEETEKQKVAENAKKDGRIEEPEELLSIINKEINAILEEKYDITPAKIYVTSSDVNVGQGAVLKLTATEKQENIVKIHVEIAYSENEKKLLGKTPILNISKYLDNLNVDVSYLEDRTIYDLSVKQSDKLGAEISKVDFVNEMLSLSYVTTEGTEGAYAPKISGYISYHTETAEDKQSASYFADVPFVISGDSEFKVSKSQTSGNYEGGGGKPGGNLGGGGYSGANSGGTSSGGGFSQNIPSTTTEGLNTLPFKDLAVVPWAEQAICDLAEQGVVSGKGNKTFAPNDNVTRAEFCKMITLALDLVDKTAACEFDDVKNDAWYYTYIASAKKAGIVNGKTNDEFSPEDSITREEMAAISMRAINIEAKHGAEIFADDASISEYAKDAVYTLKELGIINGVGDNIFSPKTAVTRAMAAKVIYMLGNVR